MHVPFTQYLRPSGEPREGGFEVSDEVGAKARELLDKGVHFDAEVLSTGHLSLTAEQDDLDDPVLAIAVFAQKSPAQVLGRVEQLITDAALMWSVRSEAV